MTTVTMPSRASGYSIYLNKFDIFFELRVASSDPSFHQILEQVVERIEGLKILTPSRVL